MKRFSPTLSLLAIAALLAYVPALSGLVLAGDGGSGGVPSPNGDPVAELPAPVTTSAGLPDLREAVRVVTPAVVNVNTSRRVPTHLSPMMPGSPFGDDLFSRLFRMPQPRQQLQQSSLGSGVIVDDRGYVLTNNHVVQGAEEVSVTLSDGRTFEAEVVGLDAPTDLAVLRIDADDYELTAAELADSAQLEPGDWVLAVGNPFGLGHTVTHGIVSATGRTGVGVTKYEDFIQTDAAINPGNSGGPLVDMAGRIVGINTAIASRNGGNMGVGFAIPSAQAANIMANLIEHGRVDRGWLGVYIQDLEPDLAESFDYDGAHGVLVTQVIEDSPADAAGLEAGDIVMRLDGREMTSANTLSTTVGTLANGTSIELEVFRDGRRFELEATIGRSGRDALADGGTSLSHLGLSGRGLTPELVRRHDLSVAEGVLITAVEPGGLADRIGLRPGHVILAVGDRKVTTSDELTEALDDLRVEDGIRLLLDVDGRRRFLLLRP